MLQSCRTIAKLSQSDAKCRKVSQKLSQSDEKCCRVSQSRRKQTYRKVCRKVVAKLPQSCHRVVVKLRQSLNCSKVSRKVIAKCVARFAQVYVTWLPKPIWGKPLCCQNPLGENPIFQRFQKRVGGQKGDSGLFSAVFFLWPLMSRRAQFRGAFFAVFLGAVGRQPPPANPFSKPLNFPSSRMYGM